MTQATPAYPRSHGATGSKKPPRGRLWGLSPLARGNHVVVALKIPGVGPIPARTGQPPRQSACWPIPGAYPRSHGATSVIGWRWRTSQGLSPLARGNLAPQVADDDGFGPIPARTGQPLPMLALWCPRGAYPRSHGATAAPRAKTFSTTGLSPLARGNQNINNVAGQEYGPIPARTGQPPACAAGRCSAGAYPRSHGATALGGSAWVRKMGLSPLARGNP